MKKTRLTAAALLAVGLSLAAAAPAFASKPSHVTFGVNVRTGPSTTRPILAGAIKPSTRRSANSRNGCSPVRLP